MPRDSADDEDFLKVALDRFLSHLKTQGYSLETVRSYGNNLHRFRKWLLDVRSYRVVADIGRHDLMEFCQVLSLWESRTGGPLSASTKNHYLHALRAFFQFQVRIGDLLSDPSAVLTNFRQQQRLPRVPSQEEVLRLLAVPNTEDWRSVRDRAWLEVFYGSGLRLSELHALDLVDLSLEEELLLVRHGKGDKDRYVPITPESARAVREYLERVRARLARKGDPALFLGERGGRMKKHQFGVWLHKYSQRAGLEPPLTPHSLRHACATHLLKNGASLRHIQELLGHSYLSTTQLYTKVEVGDLREVLRRCHPREDFRERS